MLSDYFFEQLQVQFDHQLPFVAFKKPDTTVIKGLLQEDDQLHYSLDFTESGFVFAPFDSENDTFLLPFENASIITHDFVKGNSNGPSNHIDHSKNEQKEFHIDLVQKGIEAINQGSFKKVVLSRCEAVETSDTNPINLFKRLLDTYPTAFVYCWYHPKVGLWLGATPETLLSIRGNRLKTMALAGTQAFEGATDVVWKEKEREEQQIVTDFIIENLRESVGRSQYSVGSLQSSVASVHSSDLKIEVSEQHTVRAGNLLHLKTDIELQLTSGTKALKPILDALHPTPAVCGFPKHRAKNFIIEHEGYPREFYAGFLGELNLKESRTRNTNRRNVENNAYGVSKTVSNLYVNLRCMQIKNDTVQIYVGGGITKDSDAELEWEETVHKSQIIKRVLI
ncbi:chorismate-binding protein [Gelidibacter salicanalis]|uniref:Chorismate-binding protein n=1 Tax=Gelidibacter salicanalis TaxID=291193 RepID=A0A934NBS1_9FLAO|nr:chorismate-binding protein [Gelidibacter salicanalis]MBJ7879945.1 chorismate-binding protein [Gelidibacter salicanalis]